jgi:hypothetical protein
VDPFGGPLHHQHGLGTPKRSSGDSPTPGRTPGLALLVRFIREGFGPMSDQRCVWGDALLVLFCPLLGAHHFSASVSGERGLCQTFRDREWEGWPPQTGPHSHLPSRQSPASLCCPSRGGRGVLRGALYPKRPGWPCLGGRCVLKPPIGKRPYKIR